MVLLLQYTLIFASVLMLVALGGCFSEHSGVINLGLEGIMVIGALGSLVVNIIDHGSYATSLQWIGAGLLYTALTIRNIG